MKHYSKKSNAKRAIDKAFPGVFNLAWMKGFILYAGDPGFDQPVVVRDMPAIKRLNQSRTKEQEKC